MRQQTRSPKLIGDFGEGLVTYALIRGGYEVAQVDHVGADLIAEKEGRRIAVSVKTNPPNVASFANLSHLLPAFLAVGLAKHCSPSLGELTARKALHLSCQKTSFSCAVQRGTSLRRLLAANGGQVEHG